MLLPLEVAKLPEQDGLRARVVNMHMEKPIDRSAVQRAAVDAGAIACVEEHSSIGGLGGAVAEALVEECPAPVARVGIPDCYCGSGYHDALREKVGLTPARIADAARCVMTKKR